MSVTTVPCASSHMRTEWHSLNWARVHRHVRKLQIRIVKATQEGKWGRVKALQWLLTHSFSGKALAVKRVTENQGKRTAGIDGEIWSTPQAKAEAVLKLKRQGYRPHALRRIYIPKRNGKQRPLDIPTMTDRAMQALYKLALDPVAETTGDLNSYGFRPARSCHDAIAQCFICLARKGSAKWVLEGDIQSCFNQICHEWLLEHIPIDKAILGKWLKAGYVEKGQLFPTEAGTPQGGIISPTLANMALDGLEKELNAQFNYNNPSRRKWKLHFVRYADDFVVTASSKELLEHHVKPVITRFLAERGLKLSEEKTQITHIEDGFDFLGFNIRKYQNTLKIKPARESQKAFLGKIRTLLKQKCTLEQGRLIQQLNPVIRGWVNYYKPWVSSRLLCSIDHRIFQAVWRWAQRRHSDKGKGWIRHKYFVGKSWSFGCGTLKLFRAQEVRKQRHAKIRGEANPYAPAWEVYFEKRAHQQTAGDICLHPKVQRLWFSQSGHCLQCRGSINEETGWHIHHLIPKVAGGTDVLKNLVLLHPNCHRQVHALNLRLEKPPKRLVKA